MRKTDGIVKVVEEQSACTVDFVCNANGKHKKGKLLSKFPFSLLYLSEL